MWNIIRRLVAGRDYIQGKRPIMSDDDLNIAQSASSKAVL